MTKTVNEQIKQIEEIIESIQRWEGRISREQNTTIEEMLYYSREILNAEKENDTEKAKRMKQDMLDSASWGSKKIHKYTERMKEKIQVLGDMPYIEMDKELEARVKHYAGMIEFKKYNG
jgi:hypothetical protein